MPTKALVILSGGQDSTTCLYWAKQFYDEVHALTFDYNQRHRCEVDAARKITMMAGVLSHKVLTLGHVLGGSSPLTNVAKSVASYKTAEELPGGLEDTFVPARNLLFISIAANQAYILGCDAIVLGVSQEDFGGYPDCRAEFIKRMDLTIEAALDKRIRVETPLLHMNKAATVKLAQQLSGCMAALAYSHTCYNGDSPPCGTCHACLLRAKGFADAGVEDPLVRR